MKFSFVVATLCVVLAAAVPAAAEEWSTVRGQVVFAGGTPPAPVAINVNKDQEHCLGKGPLFSEDWIVNKSNMGVKDVLVWLAPDAPGTPLPIHPSLQAITVKQVVMDQPQCAFVPHVLGIREGQELVVKNSSPISHNISWQGNRLANPGGNKIIASGKSEIITLKAEKLPVSAACNIHPWMTAKIGVYKHPYFAVTDADGKFEMKLAPVGKYKMFVWYAPVGYRTGAAGKDGEPITIKAGETDLGKMDIKP